MPPSQSKHQGKTIDLDEKRTEALKKQGTLLKDNEKTVGKTLATRTNLSNVELQAVAHYDKMLNSLTRQQSRLGDLEKLAMRRGDLEAKKLYERKRYAISDKKKELEGLLHEKNPVPDI